MKKRLNDHLVCPIDQTPLELVVWETEQVEPSEAAVKVAKDLDIYDENFPTEIITGLLLNRKRRVYYPIYRGVPRMLVFPTSVAQEFQKENSDKLKANFNDFTLPNETPAPGEEEVLRTFSAEWTNYEWDPEKYWSQTADNLYKSMDYLLDLEKRPEKGKLLLEVGIGVGGIADYITRTQQCEMVGVDLGYAVDLAYKHFGGGMMHVVQCSVFAPPFASSTFDFVYSQGVIHHTYSTQTAFGQISRLPKPGGRLYIWVYSPKQESRSLERRMLMAVESVARPVISKMPEGMQSVALAPTVPIYMLKQFLRARKLGEGYVNYGWREAIHAARDRLTPTFIHRHTEEEVSDWFKTAGYKQIQCISQRPQPEYLQNGLYNCTAVDGVLN